MGATQQKGDSMKLKTNAGHYQVSTIRNGAEGFCETMVFKFPRITVLRDEVFSERTPSETMAGLNHAKAVALFTNMDAPCPGRYCSDTVLDGARFCGGKYCCKED